jgi:hypothetical protein
MAEKLIKKKRTSNSPDLREIQTQVTISYHFVLIKLAIFFYSYVHTRLGSFLLPAPTPSLPTHSAPSLSPPPPQTQQKLF